MAVLGGPPIPVVLAVDLEPDGPGAVLDHDATWHNTGAIRRWVDDVRQRAEARSGHPSRVAWLLRCDPQVEAVFGRATHLIETEPRFFAAARARGDEMGVHVHAWRRSPGGGWVDDFGDPEWFAHCLDRAFTAYAEGFGEPARIASIGNRYLTPTAIERLVAHGVAIDLTAEPANGPVEDGAWPGVTGDLPDFRRTPRGLHQLAPGLVELPVTASRKRLGRDVRAHLHRMRRHGVRERLDHPVQLGGKPVPGVGFDELMADSLRHQRGRPFLHFAVRSDGVLDPVQRPRLDANVAALLAMPEAPRFAFVGPSEAVRMLEGG